MRTRSLTALLICGLGSPSGLAGQTPPDSILPDSVRFLGGITVNVARPTLTTGGSSAVVIHLDSIDRIPAPSMEDVIRSMPLIRVRTNSRGEAQPALRGSEERQIAILMDGVPLTLGWDHRTDMSIIPLMAAKRVTLVRGLSSVLYGPNTLGGILDIDVARAERRVTGVAPLSVGFSLDDTGGTRVSVNAAHIVDLTYSQWVFRGGVGSHDQPGSPLASGLRDDPDLRSRFLGDGDLRLNSDARRVDGFFMARYRADAGAWVSISASGTDVERGVPPEAHQDGPRFWRYPDQRRLIAAITAGTGQHETGVGSGDIELSVGVDLGTTLIEQFATETYGTVVDTEDADDRVITVRMLGEHTLGGSGDLRVSGTLADISHDEVLTPGVANTYRQRLWSFGAESGWRFGPGGRTTVTFGAALDGADTPETGDKPALDGISDFGARIGVSSLLRPGLLVHAGLSRRARFPSLRELYSGALGRFEPNPDLRAETLLGSEAGFTARAPRGELQLVGFHHRLEDGIVRTSITGAGGIPRFQRVNQHEVRSTGVELLVVGALGATTVTGDLTLQRVKGLDADGSEVDLEYQPSVLGKLALDLPLFAGARGGGELAFVGHQWCENPEIGGLQRLSSSRTVDVAVRRIFEFGRGGPMSRVDATASLSNVTDAAVFDQCGLPRAGRLFQIRFRVS